MRKEFQGRLPLPVHGVVLRSRPGGTIWFGVAVLFKVAPCNLAMVFNGGWDGLKNAIVLSEGVKSCSGWRLYGVQCYRHCRGD